jgi:SAM-dependent methyltransferase
MSSGDAGFVGSIPAIYERDMVPVWFEGYARDLAARLGDVRAGSVLELAAGTGVVTRELARTLPASVQIVATDLNGAMLQAAEAAGCARPVTFRIADAQKLPFGDAELDAIVCQFGVMFFPDKPASFREARRVLKPGGRYLFNVWGRLPHNPLSLVVQQAVVALFPDNPPLFFERTPFAYFDEARIRTDLAAGGFERVDIETVTLKAPVQSAASAARGLCEGTPLRGEIEARAPGRLGEVTAAATRAVEARFGKGSFEHQLEALVVSVRKP